MKLIIFGGVLASIFFALKLLKKIETKDGSYPYKRKKFLFSEQERSFFGVLNQALGEEYNIFAKVRLADIFYIQSGVKNRQGYFNRIQSKHVDFLLCSKGYCNPLMAIELDDSSHNEEKSSKNDQFKNAVFAQAGIPLIRFKAQKSYSLEEIKAKINEAKSN